MCMVDMHIRNITGLLPAMDGEVVDIELQMPYIPAELLQFDLPSCNPFELCDELTPYSLVEGTALKVNEQGDNNSGRHRRQRKREPAQLAFRLCDRLGHSGYCFAASTGAVTCSGRKCRSEMSGVFFSTPASGRDGSKA